MTTWAEQVTPHRGAAHTMRALDLQRLLCACGTVLIAAEPTPAPPPLHAPDRCQRHPGQRHGACGPCRAEQLEVRACDWCGRAIRPGPDGLAWLAVKGTERGFDPAACDASDDGRHEPRTWRHQPTADVAAGVAAARAALAEVAARRAEQEVSA